MISGQCRDKVRIAGAVRVAISAKAFRFTSPLLR